MKIRILRSALEDLEAGRRFYDGQQEGVGDYFCQASGVRTLRLLMAIRKEVALS